MSRVGIWNNSGYTRIGIINIQHILQCPLIKHLRCPLSIPNHVFNVPCPYKSLSISTISNIKVDHSLLSTNITRQQPMFQMLNEMSIATRLHEFFSCRRIQEELILFYFISLVPPKFIRDSPQFG